MPETAFHRDFGIQNFWMSHSIRQSWQVLSVGQGLRAGRDGVMFAGVKIDLCRYFVDKMPFHSALKLANHLEIYTISPHKK